MYLYVAKMINYDQQNLHKEGGDKEFWLSMPEAKIPEWFNHSCSGSSFSFWFHGSPISFWFRKKFPAIYLCVFTEQNYISFHPKLIINGHEVHHFSFFLLEKDHILIRGLKLTNFKDKVDDVLSTNEWSHVELYSNHILWRAWAEGTMQIGLHVFKQGSSMEDIRFTDPYLHKEEHRLVDTGHSQTHFIQQQQQNLASLEPHARQVKEPLSLLSPPTLNDNVNWDSNSMASKQINSATNVQGTSFSCAFTIFSCLMYFAPLPKWSKQKNKHQD